MKTSDVTITGVSSSAESEATQPLYSSQPAAGFPAPGDDMVEESLNIHDLVVQNPTATFFVRVSGNSMEGAGIFSGDVLVVDRSKVAKNNSIVVAAVYGELVVKRVLLEQGMMQLCSENEEYEPILVNDTEDCFVWGVVVGSVRKFT